MPPTLSGKHVSLRGYQEIYYNHGQQTNMGFGNRTHSGWHALLRDKYARRRAILSKVAVFETPRIS